MKNKKTYAELEKSYKIAVVCFWIVWVLLIFISIYGYFDTKNLKSQLQECQENIPTWTLEVECEDKFLDELPTTKTIKFKFDNYEEYLSLLNIYKNTKECEVLE